MVGRFRAGAGLPFSANPDVTSRLRCQHGQMTPSGRQTSTVVAAGLATCYAVVFVGLLVADHRLADMGRPDLRGLQGETWIVVAGIVSATVVGVALTSRHPRHPVGWLFLALAGSMLMSGVIDSYARYGVLARPGSLPGAEAVAVVGDITFIPWLVLVALILYLTPSGRHLGRWWALSARATAVAGVVALGSALVAPREPSPPLEDVANPMAVPGLQPWSAAVAGVSTLAVGAGLIAGAASLVLRFRRSSGNERRQLLWLAFAVVPLPLFVVLAFVASRSGHEGATLWASGGFIVLVPVVAGLCVTRFHLYNVERLLAATVTYVLLSLLLVATYAVVVFTATHGLGAWSASSELSATLGAVAAAAVAAPLRSGLQNGLDRRFNRRRYEAQQVIRSGLADAAAGVDVERLFRRAFRDDSLTIVYPGSAPDIWLTMQGLAPAPAVAHVEVTHDGRIVAQIRFNPSANDRETLLGGVSVAASELDNVRLRAELSRQVAEISASRRRLAGAQRRERRRIERDLHDGAQQSLLALAFDLQAAQLSGNQHRMRQALSDGVGAAHGAVRELRELANGLHPAALADGGLGAALDDLSRHSPVPLRVRVDAPRLDPGLEFTAWLVACEAVVNAQKHAAATAIEVDVAVSDSMLSLDVCDDGVGGANPDGRGLRGIRDRTEAARGTLMVTSVRGKGTRVAVKLPCE